MTYVSDMNSDQLASHMSMLQATPGWHAPLDDRLWAEVQALKNEVQRITEARRIEFNNAEQVKAELESHKRMLLAACAGLGAVGEALGADSEDDASEIEGLAVELRKDAERYRWLRERDSEKGITILSVGEWTAGATCIALTFHSAEEVDITVDAEMAKEAAQ